MSLSRSCQLIGAMDNAVIVTTPHKVATVDVRKSIMFCRKLHVPILGAVENMNGFACPKCGEVTPDSAFGRGEAHCRGHGCAVPGLHSHGP